MCNLVGNPEERFSHDAAIFYVSAIMLCRAELAYNYTNQMVHLIYSIVLGVASESRLKVRAGINTRVACTADRSKANILVKFLLYATFMS